MAREPEASAPAPAPVCTQDETVTTAPTQEPESEGAAHGAEASHEFSKVARGDWVRGGTTSSAHDAAQAAAEADAEARRAHQDEMRRLAGEAPQEARLHSMDLFSSSRPSIVLAIMSPKKIDPEGWITCELTATTKEDGEPDLILVMACPACFVNHGTAQAQVTLRQSHTGFTLDTARAGQIWFDPYDRTPVLLAGEITLHKWVKCPGLGCPWSFMIDRSRMYCERR